MDIDVFSARELPTVFRVLRTALAPSGALRPRERSFLETYARITGFALSETDPDPIDAREVSIMAPHARKRLLQLGAIAALLSRPVKADSVAFLRALSRELATHDSVLDVLDELLRGRRLRVRLIAMRRAFRVMLKEAWIAEGPMGVARSSARCGSRQRSTRTSSRGTSASACSPRARSGASTGSTCSPATSTSLASPPGSPPRSPTTTSATCSPITRRRLWARSSRAASRAATAARDGFFFFQFVLLQFHHGIQITPATTPELDHFDPELVLWAIHRGAKCNVDMTHQWNYWPLMSLPLHEARERCGLLPKLGTGQAVQNIA